MIVHLVDGTYELYRQYYGRARHSSKKHAAVEGVLESTRKLIDERTGPVGVATDHIIESFRNDLYDGYKTSEGMEPDILEQIPILEDRLRDIGVRVWPMVEFEADDALASAATIATQDPRVHQVRIYSPDKDLAQCVAGRRVVLIDQRTRTVIDETAVVDRFGIPVESIADYLALVGDSADGFPGVPGWGAVSARALLGQYRRIDDIPRDPHRWAVDGVAVRGSSKLAESLREHESDITIFLSLASLVTTIECDGVLGGGDRS